MCGERCVGHAATTGHAGSAVGIGNGGVVRVHRWGAAFWSCVEAHDERCVLELCGGS